MPADAEKSQENASEKTLDEITLSEFLVAFPPGKERNVIAEVAHEAGTLWSIKPPPIRIYCDSPVCQGIHFFDPNTSSFRMNSGTSANVFWHFSCRHCTVNGKTFALYLFLNSAANLVALKVGEWPIFGPHVPSRVLSIVGPDQEYFLKGRRAESQGMGIAAFAYYRRVVENQKSRLIDQIANVAKRINADKGIIEMLDRAKGEGQFSAAVDMIKDAVPEVLRIDGHNPLKLLHSALSEGLHSQDDDECLELATSIRVLLSDLCERISTALKEEAEIQTALSRLLTRSQKKAGG